MNRFLSFPLFLLITISGLAQQKRLNIVFILSDDQAYNTIHALGNKQILTPNLDYLVSHGTTFTRAHIMGGRQGAICAPSRAMTLTGTFANHLTSDGYKIPEATPTLPEMLRQAGYFTFETGKWHSDKASFHRSFSGGENIFFGGMHEPAKGGHFSPVLNHYDSSGVYPKSKEWIGTQFSSIYYTEAAVNFINNYNSDQPFFLYIPFTSPHDPRTPPAAFQALYKADTIALPPAYLPDPKFDNGELQIRDELLLPYPRKKKAVREEVAKYYAMITEMDSRVGEIIAALKEKNIYENTLIVFAGDNGLSVGNHGLLGKQNLYDNSVRVPLIFCGPSVPANKRSDALVYLPDITPTVLAYTGVKKPASVESENLQPIISGQKQATRKAVYYLYRDFQRGVRTEDNWKLIVYRVKGETRVELFDLNNDPYERNDLSEKKQYVKKTAELKTLLLQQMKQYGDNLTERDLWGSSNEQK
jgi:arylsulfatase A-like enzyme